MAQSDLFTNPAASAVKVRNDARPTSRAAARHVLPKSGTQRRRVLDAIILLPMTDEEISGVTGLADNSVRPRRLELLEAGWIRDSGERRRTRLGNPAVVWDIHDRRVDLTP